MWAVFVCMAAAAPTVFTAASGGGVGFVVESSAGAVTGRVDIFTASLDLSAGTGSLVVDPASLTTGFGPRDQRMLVASLDVVTFPELRFDVLRLQRAPGAHDTGPITLVGVLTLHGVQRPVLVPATLSRDGGQLRMVGEVPLALGDYLIADPSVVMARVAPTAKVTFDLVGTAPE